MSLKMQVPWAIYEGGDAFIEWVRKIFGHVPFPFVSANVVVINSDQQILLLRRSDDGRWGFPAGVVDPRESPQEGAIRELSEETSLIVRESDLYLLHVEGGENGYRKYPNGDEALFTRVIFVTKKYTGNEVRLNDENTEAAWFSRSSLPDNCLDVVYRIAQILSARWHEISIWD